MADNPDTTNPTVADPTTLGPAAYSVTIVGDLMAPRFRDGEYVIADPDREVRPGNDVVVQFQLGDGEPIGYVRRFVSEADGIVRLKTLNPENVEERDDAVSVHRVCFCGTPY